jgi:tetratricopeptide (TPR) repeat protein
VSAADGAITREVVLDPDALARMEEERDFLRRSLEDLDRELAAGDIDPADHAALREDYLRRLDAALATIAAGRVRVPAPRRPWRWLAIGAGIVVMAVLAGVLVAQGSGRRESGELPTGDIRTTARARLAAADRLLAEGNDVAAIEAYDEVLAEDPANVHALTYKAWAQVLAGQVDDGLLALIDAAEADPTYPDVHAFLAIVFDRLGRPETALAELDRLEQLDPPPAMRDLVAGLRARLEETTRTTTSSR